MQLRRQSRQGHRRFRHQSHHGLLQGPVKTVGIRQRQQHGLGLPIQQAAHARVAVRQGNGKKMDRKGNAGMRLSELDRAPEESFKRRPDRRPGGREGEGNAGRHRWCIHLPTQEADQRRNSHTVRQLPGGIRSGPAHQHLIILPHHLHHILPVEQGFVALVGQHGFAQGPAGENQIAQHAHVAGLDHGADFQPRRQPLRAQQHCLLQQIPPQRQRHHIRWRAAVQHGA